MTHKSKSMEWNWKDTLLKSINTQLTVADIKQLLISRGAKNNDLNKIHLIISLVSNYDADLKERFKKLTIKQLLIELKLRGLNDKKDKKGVLLSRLMEASPDRNVNNTGIWLLQKSAPINCTNPIVINANKIYFTTTKFKIGDNTFKFCIFDAVNKQWNEWIKFPIGNVYDWNHKSVYSANNKVIYTMFTEKYLSYRQIPNQILFKTCINTENCISISDKPQYIGTNKIAVMHTQFHILKKISKKQFQHLILNEDTKTFNISHTFDDYGIESAELIVIPARNVMLLVGNTMKNTYIYSSVTHKWSTSALHIPTNIFVSGYCITMNSRYILLFGGQSERKINAYYKSTIDYDYIHIIDMNSMKLMKSLQKCPIKSTIHQAVITNNTLEQNIAVFGYIRDCWKSDLYCNMRMPPDYIIRLISTWCSLEYVHLWSAAYNWDRTMVHNSIRLDDILKCEIQKK
eukprot:192817_1